MQARLPVAAALLLKAAEHVDGSCAGHGGYAKWWHYALHSLSAVGLLLSRQLSKRVPFSKYP
jgi:hypothetical protein